ncbi:hypothetical protein MPSYJ_26650 [Mycolicibacterium psychrotolerans]|uniref:Uncharacterized protein n=1 Tax=Mycolicibacterium psychrotolerans TaxID=216929 RepID=A0A7I7MAH8_9MYCO|nr:hypothetical protein MPSYJ_26650 [Mycolicibacterium psychrotolerans]
MPQPSPASAGGASSTPAAAAVTSAALALSLDADMGELLETGVGVFSISENNSYIGVTLPFNGSGGSGDRAVSVVRSIFSDIESSISGCGRVVTCV